jgi:hypothetical protein
VRAKESSSGDQQKKERKIERERERELKRESRRKVGVRRTILRR